MLVVPFFFSSWMSLLESGLITLGLASKKKGGKRKEKVKSGKDVSTAEGRRHKKRGDGCILLPLLRLLQLGREDNSFLWSWVVGILLYCYRTRPSPDSPQPPLIFFSFFSAHIGFPCVRVTHSPPTDSSKHNRTAHSLKTSD